MSNLPYNVLSAGGNWKSPQAVPRNDDWGHRGKLLKFFRMFRSTNDEIHPGLARLADVLYLYGYGSHLFTEEGYTSESPSYSGIQILHRASYGISGDLGTLEVIKTGPESINIHITQSALDVDFSFDKEEFGFWKDVTWGIGWKEKDRRNFAATFLGGLFSHKGDLIALESAFGKTFKKEDRESLAYLRGLKDLDVWFLANSDYGDVVREYAMEHMGLIHECSSKDFRSICQFSVLIYQMTHFWMRHEIQGIFVSLLNRRNYLKVRLIQKNDQTSVFQSFIELTWEESGRLWRLESSNLSKNIALFWKKGEEVEESYCMECEKGAQWIGQTTFPGRDRLPEKPEHFVLVDILTGCFGKESVQKKFRRP